MDKPYALEIQYCDPFEVFAPFAKTSGALFLDSSSSHCEQGRYSFIALEPEETIILENPLEFRYLKEKMHELYRPKLKDLPPFQGGIAGFFGYEMQHFFEKLPPQKIDLFQTPKGQIGFYLNVISFDHMLKKAWIIAQDEQSASDIKNKIDRSDKNKLPFTPVVLEWCSDFEACDYKQKVQKVIDYILDGDIFQANLTQKYIANLTSGFDPLAFYQNLRKLNPAPFSAYLNFDDFQIACSSPERFIKLANNIATTHPIKGTRPRIKDEAKDKTLRDDLLNSEKDRAENTMIVDLLRNDFSRVCIPHSVRVDELCQLYSFASVHHLISSISGQLSGTKNGFDLLEACFPGGSITGAPKVRAMEIITELEKSQRGPYCGSIGYMDYSGDMDLNIVIRSVLFQNNKACLQVGGGIVADSNPDQEYDEILDKARAVFNAFEQVYA